jgi:hypothetical protein
MTSIDQHQSSSNPAARRRDVAAKAILFKLFYVAAIGLATLGWLWFLAWCVMAMLA